MADKIDRLNGQESKFCEIILVQLLTKIRISPLGVGRQCVSCYSSLLFEKLSICTVTSLDRPKSTSHSGMEIFAVRKESLL